MPDVNLLKDTQQPDEPKPKRPSSNRPELSDPDKLPKSSLSDVFKSLLKRKSKAPPEDPNPTKISLERGGAGQRILKDSAAQPKAFIPLPEEEDFSVNLLTEDISGSINLRLRLIQFGLVVLGSLLALTLAYVGLRLYENSINVHVRSTQERTAEVQKEITNLRTQLVDVEQVNQQLKTLSILIDSHVRWTKFFERLEHYTLPDVSYGRSFAGVISGIYTFSAVTDSYENVAKQYLVFKQAVAAQDFISDFSITGATKAVENNQVQISFTVSMKVVPSVFGNTVAAAPVESPPPSP